jgi:hypothetical protein
LLDKGRRAFVNSRQSDFAMTPIDIHRVAQDWVTYHLLRRREQENSRYFCAFEKLYDMVRGEPEEAWMIMEQIRRLDSSDSILANLAAGPMEDLLVHHGNQFIERIETLARKDAIFRKMLGAVWRNKISEDIWKRLNAVAGPDF